MDAKGAQALKDYIERKQRERMSALRQHQDRVEFYIDENSQWRFRVVAANNEIVIVGEGYESKADCQSTVRNFVRPDLPWFETEDGTEWVRIGAEPSE